MTSAFPIADLAWPVTLLLAWVGGELGYRRFNIPRLSTYALAGFLLATTQLGLLPAEASGAIRLLAHIAFGILLFEAGHRFNLRWLSINPWVAATAAMESLLTFAGVYLLAGHFGVSQTQALLLASLSLATSPATIVRVINDQRGSGQVTERVLHLAVINCILAVFAFKVVLGSLVFRTSGNLWQAASSSLFVLSTSAALGGLFGLLMPSVMAWLKRPHGDSTLGYAVALIFLVSLTHSLHQSSILACLTFGLVARHRRVVLSTPQRGFGTLGDVLTLLLFVFIASTLEWSHVVAGFWLGLAIVAARLVTKIVGTTAFARLSGITLRKGLLCGLALQPISAFVVLVMEQDRHLDIDLINRLAPLAFVALVLEVFGPLLTQLALRWSRESAHQDAQ